MIGILFTLTSFTLFVLAIQVTNICMWMEAFMNQIDESFGSADKVFTIKHVPNLEIPTNVRFQKVIPRTPRW